MLPSIDCRWAPSHHTAALAPMNQVSIYIRDRREDDQARAFDALGAYLAKLVDGKDKPSNVVPIAA